MHGYIYKATTVGGVDINDLDLKWWRRQCGTVMHTFRPHYGNKAGHESGSATGRL